MTAGPTFRDLLDAAAKCCSKKNDASLFSLALPLKSVDPLLQLPLLSSQEEFSCIWDTFPDFCFVATGKCQHLELSGSRRFELAQRFSDSVLGRLIDISQDVPTHALPKTLFAFSFFEETSERKNNLVNAPAVQAVFPRWELSSKGNNCWLRLNGVVTHEAEARELVETIWLMREDILNTKEIMYPMHIQSFSEILKDIKIEKSYLSVIQRGIDLVNQGELKKLVLAAQKSILLEKPLEPVSMLFRLRRSQSSSCRFLWQRNTKQMFFGASPERLLSISEGKLTIDALAGTGLFGAEGNDLLYSDKDRREHDLVVSSIMKQLGNLELKAMSPDRPRITRHGKLLHLYTPITALTNLQRPLLLAETLHPTPAVAGLSRIEAMNWLRILEPFERENYAAPIGWIDSNDNAELRVAIRSGKVTDQKLDLTAGAGLVRGSIAEKELQEIELKLAVLADQLELQTIL